MMVMIIRMLLMVVTLIMMVIMRMLMMIIITRGVNWIIIILLEVANRRWSAERKDLPPERLWRLHDWSAGSEEPKRS